MNNDDRKALPDTTASNPTTISLSLGDQTAYAIAATATATAVASSTWGNPQLSWNMGASGNYAVSAGVPVVTPEIPNEAHVRAIIREEIANAEDALVERLTKRLRAQIGTK